MNSYTQFNSVLTGRNRQSRKLQNHTYAVRVGSDIAIRLHATNILTFDPAGNCAVTTGGWKTYTTKERLNNYLPAGWGIYQNRGRWYWRKHGQNGPARLYSDGDTIKPDGQLVTLAKPEDEKEQAKLRRSINRFAQLCADSIPLVEPSGADCWHCSMQTEDGTSLGDKCKDTSHLESHMDEDYAVPSLVYRALQERNAGQLILAATFGHANGCESLARPYVKRAVSKYLRKRFSLP